MGNLIGTRPDVSRALARIIKGQPFDRQTQLQDAYMEADSIRDLPKWAREALAAQGIT